MQGYRTVLRKKDRDKVINHKIKIDTLLLHLQKLFFLCEINFGGKIDPPQKNISDVVGNRYVFSWKFFESPSFPKHFVGIKETFSINITIDWPDKPIFRSVLEKSRKESSCYSMNSCPSVIFNNVRNIE